MLNNIYNVVKSQEETVRISRILVDEFPVIQEMWAKQNLRVLAAEGVGPFGFMSRMPIKTLADLKGKKMWSSGRYKPLLFKAIGVVPVAVGSGDVYDAIRSGLLDGNWGPMINLYMSKFCEVAPYFLMADTGAVHATPIFMNLKTHNSLPADLRKIIDDVSRESDDFYLQVHWAFEKKALDFLKTRVTFTTMSPEEMQTWIKAIPGTTMIDIWLADMDKWGQGAPARKVADRMIELAAPGWKIAASAFEPAGVLEWVYKSPVTGKDIRQ